MAIHGENFADNFDKFIKSVIGPTKHKRLAQRGATMRKLSRALSKTPNTSILQRKMPHDFEKHFDTTGQQIAAMEKRRKHKFEEALKLAKELTTVTQNGSQSRVESRSTRRCKSASQR